MTTTTSKFELADATRVRVLETNLLHANDVIYWLDGSSANNVADMTRIGHALELDITEKPRAIKLLNSAGKTAFWSTPTTPMVNGATTEAQRQRPAVLPFSVAGSVTDLTGTFNPAAFELTLGSGDGHAVVLFPSPAGVRIPVAGAVQGQVKFADSGAPLIWGLLTLTVTLGLGETINFQGQTNAKGDFVLALKRLPPLPLSVSSYSAELRIQGLASANAQQPINIADLIALELESTSVQDDFSALIPLTIRPGEIKRITSFNSSFIAVQVV